MILVNLSSRIIRVFAVRDDSLTYIEESKTSFLQKVCINKPSHSYCLFTICNDIILSLTYYMIVSKCISKMTKECSGLGAIV